MEATIVICRGCHCAPGGLTRINTLSRGGGIDEPRALLYVRAALVWS